jgi:membrane protein
VKIAMRVIGRIRRNDATDWAAAMTYYAVLALFPAVAALVALLSLFGNPATTTQSLINLVSQLAPSAAVSLVSGPIAALVQHRSAAGVAFWVGLVLAVWSASGYMGVLSRALNTLWEVKETRSFIGLRLTIVFLTVIGLVTALILASALVLSGGVATAVGSTVGVGSAATTAWVWLRWPLALLFVVLFISLVFRTAPNAHERNRKWVSAGSLLALAIWALGSAGFAIYVSHFGSYSKTYGTLAAVIIFLVWLWLSNLALLIGASLDVELEARSSSGAVADPPAGQEMVTLPRTASPEVASVSE